MVISGYQRLLILDKQCVESLKTAYRPGSIKNYKTKANSYLRFTYFHHLKPFPAQEWQLVRYVRYLANGVTSYDTVKGYLSGVKCLHEIGGFPFPPPHQLKILGMEMRSIKFELAGQVKKAVPVTPKLLLKIYNIVDFTDNEQLVAYVALVVGFMLFLRKSNLVPESRGKFNGKEQLTWDDLWWYGEVLMVVIKWSKTLQYREKELELPLVRAQTFQLCGVHWINHLQSAFKPEGHHPVFSYPKCGEIIPLTYDRLSKLYKGWVAQLGLDPEKGYTLHGLRRGGANHALTVGICGEDIQLMGDWRSDAYMQYIDLNLDRKVFNMVQFVQEMDRESEELWEGLEDEVMLPFLA